MAYEHICSINQGKGELTLVAECDNGRLATAAPRGAGAGAQPGPTATQRNTKIKYLLNETTSTHRCVQ